MPYLTPNEIPEGDICRPLVIPLASDWLAFFGGALTELTKAYNWEKEGTLTVAETVEKMQEIVDAWYSGVCSACLLPGGYRVIRIGATGRLEQLTAGGEWEDATDDYAIPPPAARTGGTETDQICLAAKNAVNVLQTLYESLSDSYANDLTENEALTAFIALLIALTGFAFAPIAWAIAAFFLAIFEVLYSALRYLTADLWDEDVSAQLVCFLIECANNDAGVVTFNWDCLMEKLNSMADGFGLTEVQLRLYVQISYLLYFIGGVDGLNLAARTTEITDDVCEECVCQVELEDFSGYGTVENIGGNRWRVTAGPIEGGWGVNVHGVGLACWGYINFEMLSGTVTYADGTGCAGALSAWARSCDESNDTGYSADDIVTQFLFSNIGAFSFEMDAICHEDCVDF